MIQAVANGRLEKDWYEDSTCSRLDVSFAEIASLCLGKNV